MLRGNTVSYNSNSVLFVCYHDESSASAGVGDFDGFAQRWDKERKLCALCASNYQAVSFFRIGECFLFYTQQPSTTLKNCSSRPERYFELRMACIIIKSEEGNESNSFDLSWYRRRSCDGVVQNLGPDNSKQEWGDGVRINLQGIANLNGAPFSEEMPGEYWCQATITNDSGQYLVTKSNVLTVLRPEDYLNMNMSVCIYILSTSESKCAYPPTVVWKFFVVQKFSWIDEPTKIY